VTAAGYFI